jgi:adenine-specific DNA-methyltransferase
MENINDLMPLSNDWNKERLTQLKNLFPDLFTNEGKLNIDELKKVIDPQSATETERYEFRWFGKSAAKRNAYTPSNATLVYDEQKSVNPTESENLIIEGENLEVLKLLSESYREQIKCIYIDPPYNTGGDFVYNDDYSEDKKAYWEKNGGFEDGVKIDTNLESDGRFHSNWLSMLYSRLLIARALLRSDGAIFISIGDEEYHNLRRLADEVFGQENYRNTFITKRYDKNVNRQFIENGLSTFNVGFEYIVSYSKSDEFKFNPIYKTSSEERQNFGYWKGFWNDADRATMRYDILGIKPEIGQWKWGKDRGTKAMENYIEYVEKYSAEMSLEEYWIKTGKQLEFIRRNPKGQGKNLGVEHWIAPTDGILRNTNLTDFFASKATPAINGLFDFPKNVDVIKTLIKSCEYNGDIILDFFAGSGSTGEAVFELNKEDNADRKFILVQLPEKINDKSDSESGKNALALGLKTISDITIERNKRVIERTIEEKKKQQPNLFTNGHKEDALRGLGFKIFKLVKSNFPRVEFAPDPEKSEAENIELLKKYIADKEAQLTTMFNRDELLTEILLKNGYHLNYKTEKQEQFKKNEIVLATDGTKETLICLDISIDADTVEYFKKHTDKKFICLERALDTTKKYNLKHYLGDLFKAF